MHIVCTYICVNYQHKNLVGKIYKLIFCMFVDRKKFDNDDWSQGSLYIRVNLSVSYLDILLLLIIHQDEKRIICILIAYKIFFWL